MLSPGGVSGGRGSLCVGSCKGEIESARAGEASFPETDTQRAIATSAQEPVLQFGVRIMTSISIDAISEWCEGCRVSL